MRLALALLACGLAGTPAAQAIDKLDGAGIRRAFEGNTVSGRYTNGGFFTEYHHVDGRALGHNGWQPNRDACWTTRANDVCYYYGPQDNRTVHCFTVELSNKLYILRNVSNGQINALASIEPGNPRSHGDGGEPWHCDGLISKAPALPMTPRPAALRAAPLPR